jgi:hypothetical protein
MEYARYTESLRQQLMRRGYKFIQWGPRLSPDDIGLQDAGEVACFEMLVHKEKVGSRRTVYEIDGEKACGETHLPQVHFYVKLPI